MKVQGRKDVIEAVLIAALSAVAVKAVDAIADHIERKKNEKLDQKCANGRNAEKKKRK